ncbi:acyltransferase [Halorubrum pallidum]
MSNRIHSVDAMRIVAVVFVVMIHTDPFQGLGTVGNAVNFGIKSISRFAVPFFFLTSGYFFAKQTAERDVRECVLRRAGTLGSLYVFGLALAAPTFLVGRSAVAAAGGESVGPTVGSALREFGDPVELLYYGTSVSEVLWFIPALFVSLFLVAAFASAGLKRYAPPVALAFHVVGILGTSYGAYVHVPFEVRDALFFGFFYASLGYAVAERGLEPSRERSRPLLVLTCVFAALHLLEFALLGYPLRGEPFGSYVFPPSYGFATVPWTLALFLFLLSRPSLGANTPLPSWGTYAVGVYVVHPAVLAAVNAIADGLGSAGYAIDATVGWHLLTTPATVLGALACYLLADRLGIVVIGGDHLPGRPLIRRIGRE